MREEHSFRLGRVDIEGEIIEFEPAPSLRFSAHRGDSATIGVAYNYREASQDKEVAHIRLTAHVDGMAPRSTEAVIHDNPLADDSRRGFIGVPLALSGSGTLKGRFTIETRYGSGPWTGPADREVRRSVTGEFSLVVS
jgi:hypothetical protein